MSVVAVAPYYIGSPSPPPPHSCADTPFLGEWSDWTEDTLAAQALQESAQGKKVLE